MHLLHLIIDHIFGHKYYVNIVNVKGTDKLEATLYIHPTLEAARQHAKNIEDTRSFIFVETVSFRSHKKY